MKTNIILALVATAIIFLASSKPRTDYEELVRAQSRLIELQDSLLKDACAHDAEHHDCDVPYMDTDTAQEAYELSQQIKSWQN